MLIFEQLSYSTTAMKKINFKSVLAALVVSASIFSFAFLSYANHLEANAEAETPSELLRSEVELPDVSIFTNAANFIIDNLPAD